MSEQTPETELLARIAADDQTAFAELSENHGGLIRTTLRRCGIKKTNIADLQQDVLLHIYRKRKLFDPTRGGANWIITLTREVAKHWKRDNQPVKKYDCPIKQSETAACPRCQSKHLIVYKHRVIYKCADCCKEFPLDFELPNTCDEEPPDVRSLCDQALRSADEIAETNEQIALMRERMELLHPSRLGALKLFYFEGLTHEEIATRMNITNDSSRHLVSRAIEALRRMDDDNEGTAPSPAKPKKPLISGGAHVLAIAV